MELCRLAEVIRRECPGVEVVIGDGWDGVHALYLGPCERGGMSLFDLLVEVRRQDIEIGRLRRRERELQQYIDDMLGVGGEV